MKFLKNLFGSAPTPDPVKASPPPSAPETVSSNDFAVYESELASNIANDARTLLGCYVALHGYMRMNGTATNERLTKFRMITIDQYWNLKLDDPEGFALLVRMNNSSRAGVQRRLGQPVARLFQGFNEDEEDLFSWAGDTPMTRRLADSTTRAIIHGQNPVAELAASINDRLTALNKDLAGR